MKNIFKARIAQIFGIIALTAVILFAATACDPNEDTPDNRLTPNLNGKTWFKVEEKVVFSTNTYTVYGKEYETEKVYGDNYPEDEDDWWWTRREPVLDASGKYKWTDIQETGNYTGSGSTLRLTALTVKGNDPNVAWYGTMMDKTQVESYYREKLNEYINSMIEEYMEEEELTEAQAREAVRLYVIGWRGYPSTLTLQQVINRWLSETIDIFFGPTSYSYSFLDTDEQYLLMQRVLPQSNGTWLTGVYNRLGSYWDDEKEESYYVKDTDTVYTFTTDGTYTYTYEGTERETGSYVCTTNQRGSGVAFRTATYQGKTPVEYFAYVKSLGSDYSYYFGYDSFDRYENEDFFVIEVNAIFGDGDTYYFGNEDYDIMYDTTAKVIGWWDEDAVLPAASASIRSFPAQNRGVRLPNR